jgi:hypothetical protein
MRTNILGHAYVILGWEIQSMIHSDATTFRPRPVSPTITVQQSGAALDAREDEVIEASRLTPVISRIQRSIGPLEKANNILDVDLDIFSRKAAIQPKDPSEFRRIIRYARAATIVR